MVFGLHYIKNGSEGKRQIRRFNLRKFNLIKEVFSSGINLLKYTDIILEFLYKPWKRVSDFKSIRIPREYK